MTECNQKSLEFQDIGSRKVMADFGAGHLSSDGGGLLLRELEERLGLIAGLAKCFSDHRKQWLVEHTLENLLRQRVMGLALGYEDLNDHERLRLDPLMSVMAGREDVEGEHRRMGQDEGKGLAGKSTLNRVEESSNRAETSRYHKVVVNPMSVEDYLVECGVKAIPRKSGVIVLDVDATDDPLHGNQEGRFFHGYYGHYCYLPLYIFCGGIPLWAQLRTADRDAARGTVEAMKKIVAVIRKRFGDSVRIVIRADSGFCREELMSWCESQLGVDYVLGLARNRRLERMLCRTFDDVEQIRLATLSVGGLWNGNEQREFLEMTYQTKQSWSRERRVIGKAEITRGERNPRYVVTSLPVEGLLGLEEFKNAASLYEKFYCQRGEMENRIKEQQLDLFADRTSTNGMASNQLRLWFSTFAYFLIERLRTLVLTGTQLAKATAGTIRLRLFKLAAQVKISVRRVHVQMASSYPLQELFSEIWRRLRVLPVPE